MESQIEKISMMIAKVAEAIAFADRMGLDRTAEELKQVQDDLQEDQRTLERGGVVTGGDE